MTIYKSDNVDNRLYEKLISDLQKNRKKRVYVPVAIFCEKSISISVQHRKKSRGERFLDAIRSVVK